MSIIKPWSKVLTSLTQAQINSHWTPRLDHIVISSPSLVLSSKHLFFSKFWQNIHLWHEDEKYYFMGRSRFNKSLYGWSGHANESSGQTFGSVEGRLSPLYFKNIYSWLFRSSEECFIWLEKDCFLCQNYWSIAYKWLQACKWNWYRMVHYSIRVSHVSTCRSEKNHWKRKVDAPFHPYLFQ